MWEQDKKSYAVTIHYWLKNLLQSHLLQPVSLLRGGLFTLKKWKLKNWLFSIDFWFTCKEPEDIIQWYSNQKSQWSACLYTDVSITPIYKMDKWGATWWRQVEDLEPSCLTLSPHSASDLWGFPSDFWGSYTHCIQGLRRNRRWLGFGRPVS